MLNSKAKSNAAFMASSNLSAGAAGNAAPTLMSEDPGQSAFGNDVRHSMSELPTVKTVVPFASDGRFSGVSYKLVGLDERGMACAAGDAPFMRLLHLKVLRHLRSRM